MKYILLALLLMTSGAAIADQASNAVPVGAPAKEYFEKWCRDVVGILDASLRNGIDADDYDEEKEILVGGIQSALEITKPKKDKFFTLTLQAALNDHQYQPDTARQVMILRTYMRQAIQDYNWLDRSWWKNPLDNGRYVSEVASLALEEGRKTPTDTVELNILFLAAQRIAALIDLSDYRRTGDYSCARQAIEHALQQAQNPNLNELSKIRVLRTALRKVNRSLRC